MEASSILIVEDDHDLSRLIASYLKDSGFSVSVEANGRVAKDRIIAENHQLIVLDVMLPGLDGFSICREVRDQYQGSIVMLTALNEDVNEISGLEIGADAYLTKPVRPKVLLAHIRSLLRKTSNGENLMHDNDSLACSGIQLCEDTRSVTVDDVAIEISSAEFDLLQLLMANAGTTIDRDKIYQELLHIEYDGLDRTIDVRVSRIRKKLGGDAKSQSVIKSVRGIGYLFVKES